MRKHTGSSRAKISMMVVAVVAVLSSLLTTAPATAQPMGDCGGVEPQNGTREQAEDMGPLLVGGPGDTMVQVLEQPHWRIDANDDWLPGEEPDDYDWLVWQVPNDAVRPVLVQFEVMASNPGAISTAVIAASNPVTTLTRTTGHFPPGEEVQLRLVQNERLSPSSCYSIKVTTEMAPLLDITEVPNSWTPTWRVRDGADGPADCGPQWACIGSAVEYTSIPLSLQAFGDVDEVSFATPNILAGPLSELRPSDNDCTSYFAPDSSNPIGESTHTVTGRFKIEVVSGTNSRSNGGAGMSGVPVSGTALVSPSVGGVSNPGPSQEVALSFNDDNEAFIQCPALNRLSEINLSIGNRAAWNGFTMGGYWIHLSYEVSYFKDQIGQQWLNPVPCLDELTFFGLPGGSRAGQIPNDGFNPGGGWCGEVPPEFGSDPIQPFPVFPKPPGPGVPGPGPVIYPGFDG